MYFYKIYSLNIASSIELPILKNHSKLEEIDVVITKGETPKRLIGEDVLVRVKNQSRPREFLITNPIANFYVTNGNKIVVAVKDENEWTYIRHYLLSQCMGIIARQRGWLPIHGSAIRVKNKAVLFVGNSGAGKSTTASFFVKRGYGFVADDICLLKKKEDGEYELIPAHPNIRIWKDSLEMVADASFKVRGNIRIGVEKFNVSPDKSFDSSPLSISHIYFLQLSQEKQSSLISIDKTVALFRLLNHTYAKNKMQGIGGQEDQFFAFSHLLKKVQMKVVNRSFQETNPAYLIGIIEQDFLKNE